MTSAAPGGCPADRCVATLAGCQTKGKLLADRALSRLLRGDWPRTLEELEGMRAAAHAD